MNTLTFVSLIHTAPVAATAAPAVGVKRIVVRPVNVAALIADTLAQKAAK